MNWEALTAAASIACAIAAAFNYILVLRVQVEIGKLRIGILEDREKDREELKVWINGSFMRGTVVEEKLHSLDQRLQAVEQKVCGGRRLLRLLKKAND